MGVLLHLAAGHGHKAIPVLFGQQFTHLLAAAGVEPFADDQEGVVLLIGRGAIDRGRRWLVGQGRPWILRAGAQLRGAHAPLGRMQFRGQLRQGADVVGGGAAATADHLHAEIFDEVQQLHLHLHRRQPVVGDAADVLRQAGIGNAAHHEGTVLAEIAHVLLHLLRAGGAVEAEHIDRERLEDRHHRGDVRAHQHRAGGFHRHAHHQWPALACLAEGLLDALQRRLDLQHVLAGFDDEQIHIAGDQPLRLLGERIAHLIEAHMPERGQLGGGSHGPRHEAGLVRGGVGLRHLPRQLGGALVHGEGLILKVVLRQHDRGCTEGVGLDHIGTHLQELAMHRLHGIGAGEHQVLIAALQRRTTEILGRQVHLLQRGSSGTVKHQHRPLRAVEALKKTDPLGGEHQPFSRTRVTQWS